LRVSSQAGQHSQLFKACFQDELKFEKLRLSKVFQLK
jgi:hypothetical protein